MQSRDAWLVNALRRACRDGPAAFPGPAEVALFSGSPGAAWSSGAGDSSLGLRPVDGNGMIASPVIGTSSPGTGAGCWLIEPDRAAGVVYVRSAAADPRPEDWKQRLAQGLRHLGAAAVGAKRLDESGNVFAMGDFVIHPKGFHYLGKGTPGAAYRFPEEVDAISGGVIAVDAQRFDAADGHTLCAGELGMLRVCLALRENGGRCIAVPSVVVADAHALSPGADEAAAFEQRFGFDWLACDLDLVNERYAGSPLRWNARFFGTAMPFEKYNQRPAMHWASYQQVEVYRRRADHLAKVIQEACPAGGQALDLGCGDGLFTHLAAQQGIQATGIDLEASAIEQARAQVATHTYPGQTPSFQHAEPGPLPFGDESFDLVFMLDVIEHLPNPVAVLRETGRVIKPGGALLITTPAWQLGGSSDATYHVTEYTAEELTRQINAVGRLAGGLRVINLGKIGGVYRDLVAIAKRP